MTVCLATWSIKLTNISTSIGYSVVFSVAFIAHAFIFATETGTVVSGRIVSGKV